MASKQKFKGDSDSSDFPIELGTLWNFNFIWGIENAVGRGCKNENTDVLLVQYLLNKTSEETGTGTLVTDGIFGRKTFGAIEKFQNAGNREYKGYLKGNFCHVDGRVDPYRGRNVSTKSKTVYAIILLNYIMADVRPQYYLNPPMDPDLPIGLLQVLQP